MFTTLLFVQNLAKNNDGKSNTAQLIALIESADEGRRKLQEDVRQQAIKEKAALRNERLKSARYKMQLEITTRHLEQCLSELAKWELATEQAQPTFTGSDADANTLTRKKLERTRKEIQEANLRQDITTPRAGGC